MGLYMEEELKVQILDEMEELNKTQQKMLMNFAMDGYLDQLAMVLSYMEAEYSSRCLKAYPKEIQEKLAEKMKGYTSRDANPMLYAARVLHDSGFSESSLGKYKELIRNQPVNEVGILNLQMERKNPLLCASLCNMNKYYFEEIERLDDRAIQKILREVETQELALALKNAADEVQDKIFRNMSKRAASMLKEDMEYMGPVRLSDVAEAQSKILAILDRLISTGEIVYSRNNENLFV